MPCPMFFCKQFHKLKQGKTLSAHTALRQKLQSHASTMNPGLFPNLWHSSSTVVSKIKGSYDVHVS